MADKPKLPPSPPTPPAKVRRLPQSVFIMEKRGSMKPPKDGK